MKSLIENTRTKRADTVRLALAAALFGILLAIQARAQTPAIPAGPWKSLFNGKDLTGWVSQGNPPWSVSNGILVTKGGSAKTFLIWPEPLKDYEVEVVYKLTTTNANSGIQVRSHCLDKTKSLPNCGDYEVCGPQLDVADSYSGRLFEECAAFLQFDGQNIDNCRRTLKVGDWTTATARVDGAKIQVWLNKTFCLEYTFTNTEHLNGTVFALQSHPPFDEIDWQSVKLRKLNISGCTNPKATNFNPEATKDDGSCQVPSGLISRGAKSWRGSVSLSGSTVTYTIPDAGEWLVRLVDVNGGLIARASGTGPVAAGHLNLGKSGIYFAEVDAGGFHTRHRLFQY